MEDRWHRAIAPHISWEIYYLYLRKAPPARKHQLVCSGGTKEVMPQRWKLESLYVTSSLPLTLLPSPLLSPRSLSHFISSVLHTCFSSAVSCYSTSSKWLGKNAVPLVAKFLISFFLFCILKRFFLWWHYFIRFNLYRIKCTYLKY